MRSSIESPSRSCSRGYRACRYGFLLAFLSLWSLLSCGCPATQALPRQAPVLEMIEKHTRQPYLLFVPSTYSDDYTWPLIVACHGTWPYDTARLQMREWAQFAENKGIIVAAPTLAGTKGDFPPAPEKQIALQRKDEAGLLAVVSDIKRRYNIAEEQVFMTGWSAGAYPILYTGLRNPDVFRSLAIRQGSFDSDFMDVPEDRMDPWQRILVIYGMTDFLRDQSRAMLEWLRDNGYHPDEREIAGMHRRIDAQLAWRYFRDVVKRRPWIRIRNRAVRSGESAAVKFILDAIPPARRQKWFFGDGDTSYDAEPVHTYQAPGRYEVAVNVELKGGRKYSRKRVIRVGTNGLHPENN